LKELLGGYRWSEMAHEKLIARLDEAAQVFRVLVIKTALALPYTSVFLELGCGYWNADAERRMRKAKARGKKEAA